MMTLQDPGRSAEEPDELYYQMTFNENEEDMPLHPTTGPPVNHQVGPVWLSSTTLYIIIIILLCGFCQLC